MAFTFRGGVYVHEEKNTKRCKIENITAPSIVCIPMSQHIGAHCKPCVSVGDTVYKGTVIGKIDSGLGCPVHASVSGTVKEIKTLTAPNGAPVAAVVIENDGLDTLDPSITPYSKRIQDITPEEIIEIVRNAGISGMGGATFPTYEKIRGAIGKVRHLIINCAECEPYITANHRLLLENAPAVINGIKILMRVLGLRKAEIAVEDNKLDAINHLEELLVESDMIRVRVMKTKYPQGDERQLIYALKGIELPTGKIPADVKCIIFNAETCAAIFNAVANGMPLVERIVTCDGDCVRTPKNVRVPFGTPYLDVINFCGGFTKQPKTVINGGPMMGYAHWDVYAPVTKGTASILVFSKDTTINRPEATACIRCGKCVATCPMHLMPNYFASLAQIGSFDEAEEMGIRSCVECGSCAYTCPARVPIVQYIRQTKAIINSKPKPVQQQAVPDTPKDLPLKDTAEKQPISITSKEITLDIEEAAPIETKKKEGAE